MTTVDVHGYVYMHVSEHMHVMSVSICMCGRQPTRLGSGCSPLRLQ